jgi:NitT/TauT family transport system substrate-binding protein
MAFMAKEPDKAADIYLKTESSKTPKSDVFSMITDGSISYAVAPTGVMKFADFMAKTGEIKVAPKSWEEVFFPLIGARKGS